MSTFILKIDLGNDQMSTRAHVAQALRCVAIGMRADETWDGTITDDNGYSVGRFELENPSAPVKRIRGDQLREQSWDIAADEYEAGKLGLAGLVQRVRGDGAALSMIKQWAQEDGEDVNLYPDGGIPGELSDGAQEYIDEIENK